MEGDRDMNGENYFEPSKVEEGHIKDHYMESRQSANVLIKFMTKIDYLKDILKKKSIVPRYYEESIEYLNIKEVPKIVFPMICFCDINFSKLTTHVAYYGEYGVALNKKWAIKSGVQPIHYMNEKSYISRDFSSLFSKSMEVINNESISEYRDYILGHLLFMKPIYGIMRKNGQHDKRNFTDEKEWRYVPKIYEEDNIDLVIPRAYIDSDNAYNTYSDALTKLEHTWLTFEYKDIEYLVVKNEDDRQKLIKFILEDDNLECEEIEKYILISKIIVYDIMNKDW